MGTFEADFAASKVSSMHRRPTCWGYQPKHDLFPPIFCVRAYPLTICKRTQKERLKEHGEAYQHDFAFGCPMGPSVGSVVMLPSGRTASSA